jgi:16S rRNA G966 N2-methylase RsmD
MMNISWPVGLVAVFIIIFSLFFKSRKISGGNATDEKSSLDIAHRQKHVIAYLNEIGRIHGHVRGNVVHCPKIDRPQSFDQENSSLRLRLDALILSDPGQLIVYRAAEAYGRPAAVNPIVNEEADTSVGFRPSNKLIKFYRTLARPSLCPLAFEHDLCANGIGKIIQEAAIAESLCVVSYRPGSAHLALLLKSGTIAVESAPVWHQTGADAVDILPQTAEEMAAVYRAFAPNCKLIGVQDTKNSAPWNAKNSMHSTLQNAITYSCLYIWTVPGLEADAINHFDKLKSGGTAVIIVDINGDREALLALMRPFAHAYFAFGGLCAMTAALVGEGYAAEMQDMLDVAPIDVDLQEVLPTFNGWPDQLSTYIKEYTDKAMNFFSINGPLAGPINVEDAIICYWYCNQQAMKWCVENERANNAEASAPVVFEINKYYIYNYLTRDFLLGDAAEALGHTTFIKPGPKDLEVFPALPGVDRTRLKFTRDSLFSATPWPDTVIVNKEIEEALGRKTATLSVFDGTGNIGGNALAFARSYKALTVVEIMLKTYEALAHNIKTVYAAHIGPNVRIINGDTVDELERVRPGTYDILFLDPPWGGIPYKFYKRVRLYLSDVNVADLLVKHAAKFALYVVKVPANFDVEGLAAAMKASGYAAARLKVVPIGRYLCIFLTTGNKAD